MGRLEGSGGGAARRLVSLLAGLDSVRTSRAGESAIVLIGRGPDDDELRPEYRREELKGGARGKYLKRYSEGTNLALLVPDVRAAFPIDESVNEALRSAMHNAPGGG